MPEIRPFSGVRYNPGMVGDLGSVVAPPYDVIDPQQHRELLETSPYNCVRLILGMEPGHPGDYRQGADLMQRWLEEGVLLREETPCYYLVEESFLLPGRERPNRRWGIIGRVRLEPFGSGRIHPHERTHAGPKEDRLRLMRAFGGNLSQVFGLFDGDAASVEAALAEGFAQPPLLETTDGDGVRRSLRVLSDPATVETVSRLLSDRDIYIADGHHRYETALNYSLERAQADPHPSPDSDYRFVMMALVGMEDPGLAIFPTHRLLSGLKGFSVDRLRGCMERHFRLEVPPAAETAPLRQGILPPGDGTRGFVLYDPAADGFLRATLREEFDPAPLMGDLPPCLRRLDVTLAERLLMMDCLGLTGEQISHQEHLEYFKELPAALERARSGGQLLLIMSPPRMTDLIEVTRAGERMPQKSTFFYPKLLTGLVFYRHAD